MLLVTFTNAFENFNRLVNAWLTDNDFLEAALERGITLNVLAILIESSCADTLQFATREGGFENVSGINGAFSRTSTDQSMNLVNENDAVSAVTNFFYNFLQALFKFATIFGTSNEGANIER